MGANFDTVIADTDPKITRPVSRVSQSHHPSIRSLLGEAAWLRLPAAVRARFADNVLNAEYRGTFDIVRASRGGKLLAWLCRLIGTPVAPFTGINVPATVRVFANQTGG